MKKIRIELEIDLDSGNYDARFLNISNPGGDIDMTLVSKLAHRVLDNVTSKSTQPAPKMYRPAVKADLN